MKETEVKVLEVNKEKIASELLELGASKVFDGDLLTVFLDFPDNRIKKSRDVLRLRKQAGKAELTYKKIKTNRAVKEAEEHSVEVSDLDVTQEILQNLGLKVTARMLKHRVSYKLHGLRFDFDQYLEEYRFIPLFVEIEGPEEEISKYVEILGFSQKDCLAWGTDELIRHYSPKKS